MPISKDILNKDLANVFIETGSFEGDTIEMARELGFNWIYSIEASKEYYLKCKERFKDYKNIFLFNDESVKILPEIYPFVNDLSSFTFWLDAHYSCGSTYKSDPVLEELKIVLTTYKKGTILIDDLRCFGSEFLKASFDQILDLVKDKQIGISYEDGFNKFSNEIYKKDIMVIKLYG